MHGSGHGKHGGHHGNHGNGSQSGDNSSQPGDNGSQPGDNGSQPGDNGSQPGDNGSQPVQACGACNLQTYNIVSACVACNFAPTATEEAMEGLGNISGVAQLQSWTKNNLGSNTFNTTVPPWASAPLEPQQAFSAKLVLQAANANSNSSSTSSQASASSTSMSDSASSTSSQASSPKSLASNTMHVGAIVAGVVGGIAFLTITAIGGFCFMRYRERRRKLSYAPSNEFTAVTSRPGWSVSPEPPPFSPGAWRDPVLEKAHGSAAMQRDLDTGVYAGETSWKYDLEKI